MKDYKKILEGVVNIVNTTEETDIGFDDICAYIDENCPELKESEDKKISLEIRNFIWGYPDKLPERDKWLAWFEKQWKKESDPRYKCLEGLLEADAIYQMSMNEAMVEEAKSKAVKALSELAISKLLDLEKQGEEGYTLKSFKNEDVHKFMQYIEKQAKAYEFNLPHRGYDIYAFAKDILTWLEKQCNKPQGKTTIEAIKEKKVDNQNCVKSADKVEPKFMVGNWYQCTKDFFGKGVTFDKNTAYYCSKEGCLQNEYGCHIAIAKDLYDNFKLWTITDAKRGDILVDDYDNVLIYEEPSTNTHFHSYCYNNEKTFISQGGSHLIKGTHPANKEQRDMLFQKMKEAGFELEELKAIEQNPTDKIEPKFKVDNYIVLNDITSSEIWKVINIDKDGYYNIQCITNPEYNEIYRVPGFILEKDYRLWTIDDAKDGDVLCYENKDDFIIFIYKCGHIHYHCCYCNGHLTTVDSFFVVPKYLLGYIHPATKEQRELLFQKMNNVNNSIVEKKYDY